MCSDNEAQVAGVRFPLCGAGAFAAFAGADLAAVESRIDHRLRFGRVVAGAPSRPSMAERQSAWLGRRGGEE